MRGASRALSTSVRGPAMRKYVAKNIVQFLQTNMNTHKTHFDYMKNQWLCSRFGVGQHMVYHLFGEQMFGFFDTFQNLFVLPGTIGNIVPGMIG